MKKKACMYTYSVDCHKSPEPSQTLIKVVTVRCSQTHLAAPDHFQVYSPTFGTRTSIYIQVWERKNYVHLRNIANNWGIVAGRKSCKIATIKSKHNILLQNFLIFAAYGCARTHRSSQLVLYTFTQLSRIYDGVMHWFHLLVVWLHIVY